MTIESNTDIENERFQPEADGEIPVEAPEAVAAPPPTPPTRRRPTIRLAPADMVAGLLLIVVIVVGGYFRNLGYNWDDYTHLHPDERFLSGVTDAIGGPLNPTGDQQSQDKQRADCLLRYPAPPDHPEMAGAAT
ncbi:MAG TPA: hypothetical protein VKQ72_08090, partial [Aggregatilineales bacterium]|nr:hypothetical protein [Aggregatilineales bacterium]